MKTTKLILTAALLFIAGAIFAQPPGGGQRGGGPQNGPQLPDEDEIVEMVEEMALEISLTEVQQASIIEIYIEHYQDVEELTSGSSRPSRQKMEALKEDVESKIKTKLSDEQVGLFEEYLKSQESQRRRR